MSNRIKFVEMDEHVGVSGRKKKKSKSDRLMSQMVETGKTAVRDKSNKYVKPRFDPGALGYAKYLGSMVMPEKKKGVASKAPAAPMKPKGGGGRASTYLSPNKNKPYITVLDEADDIGIPRRRKKR